MSPLWLIGDVGGKLDIKAIVHVDIVWASFAMVEMGEWTVVVRVS